MNFVLTEDRGWRKELNYNRQVNVLILFSAISVLDFKFVIFYHYGMYVYISIACFNYVCMYMCCAYV